MTAYLIWQVGWTGRQLCKDSDRAKAAKSAIALSTATARCMVGYTKNPSTAKREARAVGIATQRFDSELLQSGFAPAQVPDAAGRSKLSQHHVVPVSLYELFPAALGGFHNMR